MFPPWFAGVGYSARLPEGSDETIRAHYLAGAGEVAEESEPLAAATASAA